MNKLIMNENLEHHKLIRMIEIKLEDESASNYTGF